MIITFEWGYFSSHRYSNPAKRLQILYNLTLNLMVNTILLKINNLKLKCVKKGVLLQYFLLKKIVVLLRNNMSKLCFLMIILYG
jgi:hypothetical protein